MGDAELKKLARQRRHKRARKRLRGTSERPRLSVFRSNRHIYAQIVDDSQGRVLASASSLSPDLRKQLKNEKGKITQGRLVGLSLAEEALRIEVKRVVFDRGGYKYGGRLKALADGAREGGLDF